MPTKRTPAQIWKELEKEAREEEEIEKIASLSDAELDAELAAGGFDVAKERAEARAVREDLERRVAARKKAAETEPEKEAPRPKTRPRLPEPEPRRLPPVVWFAAATIAAAAAGGLVYALTHPSAPPPVPSPPAPSSAPAPVIPSQRLIAASDMRRRAFAECEASRWAECIARFDDARMMDPAGDRAPEVQAAREKASIELERKEPKLPGRPGPP